MEDARLGLFSNQFDVLASFSASLVDIKRNLQSEETESDPNDERFSDAEAVNVVFQPGSAAITVKITSLAGTSRQVIAPLTVVL